MLPITPITAIMISLSISSVGGSLNIWLRGALIRSDAASWEPSKSKPSVAVWKLSDRW